VADTQRVLNLLAQMRRGSGEAAEQLIKLVYPDLRQLAAHFMRPERSDHTLQTTALIHEAYLRLLGSDSVEWQDRAHFLALMAGQMRRILVDHARKRNAQKRSGQEMRLALDHVEGLAPRRDEDLLAVHQALRRLEEVDFRASRVVELKFFGGLEDRESAEVLGVSVATLQRDWTFAKAWLLRQLAAADSERG
jgi:RNA polymerase sigma-70 factor, ECF subfamily